MSIVESTLKAHLPTFKSHSNGWLTMNCPMCVQNGQARPDTRQRGGFKFEEDRTGYHCFNCGYTTGWRPGQKLGIKLIKLMRAIGIDEGEIQRLKIQLWDQVVEDETIVDEPFKKPSWPEIQWPWAVKPITLEAAEYLDKRGILELVPEWYTSSSPVQGMDNRVILPFYDEGKLVGYNARWIGDVPDKKTAKIIASRPPSFVFNLGHQSHSRKYTIVLEGEYDALTLDGVAIMTNSISPEQAKIIEDIDNEPVVLPDRDKAGLTLALQAAELGWNVSFPDWPDGIKDANQAAQHFGRVATLQSVLSAIESSPLKIKLLARRWCQ
jgi:hypothetical protein